MKLMKSMILRALLLLWAVSVSAAEDEKENPLSVNNYSYLGVGYTYRDLRGGAWSTSPSDGPKSGRLQEGAVTLSKEWTLRSVGGRSIGLVVAPTVSYAVAAYPGAQESVSVMDFGGRVGFVLKFSGSDSRPKKSQVGLLFFTDASWQRDSVQGMDNKYGRGLEPGVQLSYQFTPRVGAALEYKYLRCSDVTRVENFATNELRLMGLFGLTSNIGLELGAILDASRTDNYQALGGFMQLRRGF